MKRSILLLLALAGCARPSASSNDTAVATPTNDAVMVMPANVATSAPPAAEPSPEPVAAGAAAPELAPAVDRQLAPLPADVLRFIAAYEECEHWAGEEPYDADRRKEIEAGVNATCTGIDARLARLNRKYSGNAAVRAKLTDYAPVHM